MDTWVSVSPPQKKKKTKKKQNTSKKSLVSSTLRACLAQTLGSSRSATSKARRRELQSGPGMAEGWALAARTLGMRRGWPAGSAVGAVTSPEAPARAPLHEN